MKGVGERERERDLVSIVVFYDVISSGVTDSYRYLNGIHCSMMGYVSGIPFSVTFTRETTASHSSVRVNVLYCKQQQKRVTFEQDSTNISFLKLLF
jgi:hypothetical protein